AELPTRRLVSDCGGRRAVVHIRRATIRCLRRGKLGACVCQRSSVRPSAVFFKRRPTPKLRWEGKWRALSPDYRLLCSEKF
ncbi:hypothetical protein L7F22_058924, partial [Adiantum nelumboides]|nr:hypothetical protein [Adiantum nelumboides]